MWLGSGAELRIPTRTGFDSFELPTRTKGRSPWTFLSACTDVGQKRKRDEGDLKAVSKHQKLSQSITVS